MEPQKPSITIRGWVWFRDMITLKPLAAVHEVARQARKLVKDDPRRPVHSLKVGLTITLVSLLYYLQPLYNNFGASAMWAIMTVVVVFEFTVGGTIGKGLNRGVATLAAAALALGTQHLASLTGKRNEPYVTGLFVFIQAAAVTFVRFFPKVKASYDYGMMIFIMTFALISISGLRTSEVVELAQARIVTVLIGAATCVAVCILVRPVWAGEDLHKLVAKNVGLLGDFLEGYMEQCLAAASGAEIEVAKPSMISLNSVLFDSKGREEALANLAGWEPGHGGFLYRHPWKQYLKIGNLTRKCGCRVEALSAYLHSMFQLLQTPEEIQCMIRDSFLESSKALKEVAWAIETMAKPLPINPHIANLKIASRNLKSLLKSHFEGHRNDILGIIPIAAVMIDTLSIVEEISDAIDELAFMAKFKTGGGNVNGVEEEPVNGNDKSFVEIGMTEISSLSIKIDENINSSVVDLGNESRVVVSST